MLACITKSAIQYSVDARLPRIPNMHCRYQCRFSISIIQCCLQHSVTCTKKPWSNMVHRTYATVGFGLCLVENSNFQVGCVKNLDSSLIVDNATYSNRIHNLLVLMTAGNNIRPPRDLFKRSGWLAVHV